MNEHFTYRGGSGISSVAFHHFFTLLQCYFIAISSSGLVKHIFSYHCRRNFCTKYFNEEWRLYDFSLDKWLDVHNINPPSYFVWLDCFVINAGHGISFAVVQPIFWYSLVSGCIVHAVKTQQATFLLHWSMISWSLSLFVFHHLNGKLITTC